MNGGCGSSTQGRSCEFTVRRASITARTDGQLSRSTGTLSSGVCVCVCVCVCDVPYFQYSMHLQFPSLFPKLSGMLRATGSRTTEHILPQLILPASVTCHVTQERRVVSS